MENQGHYLDRSTFLYNSATSNGRQNKGGSLVIRINFSPEHVTCFLSDNCSNSQLHFRLFIMEANIMDPDQNAPKGAFLSGSILFVTSASKVYIKIKEQMTIVIEEKGLNTI